ncbi:hypothetical protein MBLNU457_g2935t1 [Dothideomycetes sp. NU457]
MAVPATKRRKLSHSPVEEKEEDNASFESLGENDEEEGDEESGDDAVMVGGTGEGGEAEEKDRDDDDEDDDMEDDDVNGEEGDEDSDGIEDEADGAESNKPTPKVAANVAKPVPKRNTAAADNNASMSLTGGTFKSNMFKLQVDEMLAEIRPKHGKKEAAAEEALHKLKGIIEGLPATKPATIADAERDLIKKRVAVPFPDPKPPRDAQYKLEYQKPANINVVGSHALKLATRTNPTCVIDMVVTMPSELFQEKDYLNHRYFYKRAFYLGCIAAGLQKQVGKDMILRFVNFHDNPLKPVLEVSLKDSKDAAQRWKIHIIPVLSPKTFSNDKLLPSKNAVRPTKSEDAQDGASSLSATPFYNSSIQADRQVTAYLKLILSASIKAAAFRDACLLGRVWLGQRGLSSAISEGGFGNFEFTATMAVLLHTGGVTGGAALSPGYSSYQLFKATLQYLSAKNLSNQPAVLEAPGIKLQSIDGCPIFFDGARSHNILFKMTSWSYKHLRSEARTTLSMLGDSLFDQFEATFILRENALHQKYDVVLTLPTQPLIAGSTDDRNVLERYSKLNSVLTRGLGDRVTQVVILPSKSTAWELGTARPLSQHKGETTIGLTVNPANANRTIDHGPPAEKKKEAADFQKFWGEKSELRRFRDGSILESLVWSNDERGQSILHQVITYLIERHFGAASVAALKFVGDGFARLVRQNNGPTPFQPLMDAFKTLEDDMRGMEDIPLAMRSIAPADEQLRYSSIDVPMSSGARTMKRPADVVVQFESSGRWPDDMLAIQRTKIAFLLKISECFTSTNPSITSRVGLENTTSDFLNQGFLDIIYPTGAAFRLRIHHDREQTLLERVLKDKTAAPSTRDAAAHALATYKRDYIRSPAHTQALQKLCTRHPALSPSIRLVKKWFASHLLSSHFPAPLIELFTLRCFTTPWPWSVPSSAKTGFLRTLSFLSRFDWRAEPLIVDLGDLKIDDVGAITTRFEAWRKLDPSLNRVVIFAASSVDGDGATWSDGRPSKVVAGRMTALARAATEEVLRANSQVDAASLFVSPLQDYDFVLHLNGAFCGQQKKKRTSSSAFKNLNMDEGGLLDPAAVGRDLAKDYLEEMQGLYGDSVLLFYGGHDSKVIAGLWSPFTTARHAWKVNLGYSTRPVATNADASSSSKMDGETVEAELNKEAILAEMARLGGDLVEKVMVYRT